MAKNGLFDAYKRDLREDNTTPIQPFSFFTCKDIRSKVFVVILSQNKT